MPIPQPMVVAKQEPPDDQGNQMMLTDRDYRDEEVDDDNYAQQVVDHRCSSTTGRPRTSSAIS